MNNDTNKDKLNRDITCRSHSAKSDRELYRICPSKLSKHELEDLYFALLENNLELKRTINGQKDRIKVLSTKVQRMSAIQKNTIGREQGCCATTKAVVSDQKESIADLKKANERMSERIRLLNMRLCSAKQFLKSSPMQTMNRYRGCPNASSTLKNSSMSALTFKRSDSNLKTNGVSSQYFDKDIMTTDTIPESEPNNYIEKESEELRMSNNDQTSKDDPENCCENRCRTVMDELKQKIVDLQEELSRSKEEFSVRAARLEEEVSGLRAAQRRGVQETDSRVDALHHQLRDANYNYEELCHQLSVERRKVSELETRIKAENMSNKVAKTIEQHLSNINESLKPLQSKPLRMHERLSAPSYIPFYPTDQSSPRSEERSASSKLVKNIPESSPDTKMSKYSDDSGYLDAKHQEFDDKDMNKVNLDLTKRISYLQGQLDALKASAARDSLEEAQIRSSNYENDDVVKENNVKPLKPDDALCVIIEPKKDVAFEVEKDEKDLPSDVRQRGDPTMLAPWPKQWEPNIPSTSKGIRHSLSDEGSRSLPANAKVTSELVVKNVAHRNDDSHNKFQIPGPIPSNASESKTAKKRIKQMLKSFHKIEEKSVKSENVPVDGKAKIITQPDRTSMLNETRKTSGDSEMLKPPDEIIEEDKSIWTGHSVFIDPNISSKNDPLDNEDVREKTANTLNFEAKELAGPSTKATSLQLRDSFELALVKKIKDDKTVGKETNDNRGGSTHSVQIDSELMAAKTGDSSRGEIKDGNKQTDKQIQTIDAGTATEFLDITGDEIDLCGPRSRVCGCVGVRRSLCVFRSCSGTLRFRTVAAGLHTRHCACAPTDKAGTQIGQPPSGSPDPQHTYTVPVLEGKCSRPISPDNTEREISSLTDLPSERDGKRPRDLSLGEDKATTTYSETTSPTTDHASLSIGEMPRWGGAKPPMQQYTEKEISAKSTAQTMEASLQAISDELARCKQLLATQRDQTQVTLLHTHY